MLISFFILGNDCNATLSKKNKKISIEKFGGVVIFSYLCGMNKKEKLVKRFRTQPRDFTFDEVVTPIRAISSRVI